MMPMTTGRKYPATCSLASPNGPSVTTLARRRHRRPARDKDPASARGVFAAVGRLSTSVAARLRHGRWIRG
jgi:hypothetical protein